MNDNVRALSERYTRVAELEMELAREKEALLCQLRTLQQGLIGSRPFTPQEKTVYSLCAAGKTNKEIGNAMNIGERTVKYHLTNIFSKIGVQNRVDLILGARTAA